MLSNIVNQDLIVNLQGDTEIYVIVSKTSKMAKSAMSKSRYVTWLNRGYFL